MSRLRPRIGRRLLIAFAALALYAATGFVLIDLLPHSAWQQVGEAEFTGGQATVVPALNVFAVGIVVLAVVRPLLPILLAILLGLAVGIGSAFAGPMLAILGASATVAGLVAPGTLMLAAIGFVIAAAGVLVIGRGSRPAATD